MPAFLTKPVLIGIGVVALLLAIWAALHFYGQHRYDEGVQATDQKWQDATDKLKADAAKSATKADDAAANRLQTYVEQQTSDQEAVNEAQRNGTSPLDALFGN
jgi:hypothetical protein